MKWPALLLALVIATGSASAGTVAIPEPELIPAPKPSILDKWSFEYGVALITSENIEQLIGGTVNFDDGPAGGEIHLFTASRLLGEPEWCMFDRVFRPALELPLTLEVFDENGRSPFLDFNVSFLIRWRDFPWNRYVRTTFGTGVGLSFSEKVPAMDIQRHPDENRSHLKYNWPLQLTFGLPQYPEHNLTLFIAHQSGGRMFDTGGINSIGIGYRFARW